MLRQFFRRMYHGIPGIRELFQINDAVADIRHTLGDMQKSLRQLKSADTFRLHTELLEQHPRYADPRRLFQKAFAVCSQNGEDGMIREIFQRIGTGDRFFAEVGVGNGIENNTAFLLSQGWSGVWIDGDPSFLQAVGKSAHLQVGRLRSTVTYVSRENIPGFFESLGVPKEFDLLSLDIDQNTYFIWEALAGYRPRVVVIEYNASIPPDLDWKVNYDASRTWNYSHNYGASLKAFELLGRQLGYSLVGCDLNGINAFFVRDDLVGEWFVSPFTSENHYEPPRYDLMHYRGHPASILDGTRS